MPDNIAVQKAAIPGVGLIDAQDYDLTTPKTGEFIFSYAQLDEMQIKHRIQTLSPDIEGISR